MKKMEKTAGEKPGKDAAIRKDNEASAEKIVIPDPVKDSDNKKERTDESEKEAEDKANRKDPISNTPQKSPSSTQIPSEEKGQGLKSAVEGNSNNAPLPTDDDGTIVL